MRDGWIVCCRYRQTIHGFEIRSPRIKIPKNRDLFTVTIMFVFFVRENKPPNAPPPCGRPCHWLIEDFISVSRSVDVVLWYWRSVFLRVIQNLTGLFCPPCFFDSKFAFLLSGFSTDLFSVIYISLLCGDCHCCYRPRKSQRVCGELSRGTLHDCTLSLSDTTFVMNDVFDLY